MRADLRNRLLAIASGEYSPGLGVTHVPGVTEGFGYAPKPLALQWLREVRVAGHHRGARAVESVTQHLALASDLHDLMSERLAIIEDDGTVPPIFRTPWARLNCERPIGVADRRWWDAIIAGGLLLDLWEDRAAEPGWRVEDLFSLDNGILWFLADYRGSAVTAINDLGASITTATGDQEPYQRRWTQ